LLPASTRRRQSMSLRPVEPKNIPTHGNPSTVRLIEVLLPSGLDDICLRVVKIDVSAEEYMSLSGHR
jgi:hypothetical protein